MYILKTVGTYKVPDYVQIRDDDYKLIELIKLSFFEKKVKEKFDKDKANEIIDRLNNTPYGEVIEIKGQWEK